MSRKLKVAVVGAGVIGLSAALHLTERFPSLLDVTVIADRFTPDTTSDKAGMMIMPVDLSSPSGESEDEQAYHERVRHWAKESFAKFSSIYSSELNSEIQICLRSGYCAIYEISPDPWWKELVFGFRHVELGSAEARAVNISPQCCDVWAFATYIFNCSNYLSWMMKQFQQNGGQIEKRTVKSLDELSSCNIIINCTGVWAGNLVEEHNMQPCRGQVVLVRAPWISNFHIDESSEKIAYILPRANSVVLGGTFQMGNWSEQPDPEIADSILENAMKLKPSLSRAEVIGGWAGLRPVRNRVRLDTSVGPKGGLVIHCYGHGGQGITLSWGCAKDIGKIVYGSCDSAPLVC